MAMPSLFFRRVGCGGRDGLSAARGDAHQTSVAADAEQDRVVRAPGAAHLPVINSPQVTDGLSRTAGGIDLLEFALSEKRNGPAVRRPEWRPEHALGAREHLRLQRIERS